jgi:hypothetical protein
MLRISVVSNMPSPLQTLSRLRAELGLSSGFPTVNSTVLLLHSTCTKVTILVKAKSSKGYLLNPGLQLPGAFQFLFFKRGFIKNNRSWMCFKP